MINASGLISFNSLKYSRTPCKIVIMCENIGSYIYFYIMLMCKARFPPSFPPWKSFSLSLEVRMPRLQ